MSSTDPGTSSAQTTSPVNTGKADSYIPVFTNQQRDYKEFKKRAEIYRVKMRLAGRQKETVFNLVTVMVGKAWDLVEDLPVSEMEKEEGFTKLFERLDKGFSYEPLTELPDDFEAYFIRLPAQEWTDPAGMERRVPEDRAQAQDDPWRGPAREDQSLVLPTAQRDKQGAAATYLDECWRGEPQSGSRGQGHELHIRAGLSNGESARAAMEQEERECLLHGRSR